MEGFGSSVPARASAAAPRPAPGPFRAGFPAIRRLALAGGAGAAYSGPIEQRNTHQGAAKMITVFFAFVTCAFFFAIAANVAEAVSSARA